MAVRAEDMVPVTPLEVREALDAMSAARQEHEARQAVVAEKAGELAVAQAHEAEAKDRLLQAHERFTGLLLNGGRYVLMEALELPDEPSPAAIVTPLPARPSKEDSAKSSILFPDFRLAESPEDRSLIIEPRFTKELVVLDPKAQEDYAREIRSDLSDEELVELVITGPRQFRLDGKEVKIKNSSQLFMLNAFINNRGRRTESTEVYNHELFSPDTSKSGWQSRFSSFKTKLNRLLPWNRGNLISKFPDRHHNHAFMLSPNVIVSVENPSLPEEETGEDLSELLSGESSDNGVAQEMPEAPSVEPPELFLDERFNREIVILDPELQERTNQEIETSTPPEEVVRLEVMAGTGRVRIGDIERTIRSKDQLAVLNIVINNPGKKFAARHFRDHEILGPASRTAGARKQAALTSIIFINGLFKDATLLEYEGEKSKRRYWRNPRVVVDIVRPPENEGAISTTNETESEGQRNTEEIKTEGPIKPAEEAYKEDEPEIDEPEAAETIGGLAVTGTVEIPQLGKPATRRKALARLQQLQNRTIPSGAVKEDKRNMLIKAAEKLTGKKLDVVKPRPIPTTPRPIINSQSNWKPIERKLSPDKKPEPLTKAQEAYAAKQATGILVAEYMRTGNPDILDALSYADIVDIRRTATQVMFDEYGGSEKAPNEVVAAFKALVQ